MQREPVQETGTILIKRVSTGGFIAEATTEFASRFAVKTQRKATVHNTIKGLSLFFLFFFWLTEKKKIRRTKETTTKENNKNETKTIKQRQQRQQRQNGPFCFTVPKTCQVLSFEFQCIFVDNRREEKYLIRHSLSLLLSRFQCRHATLLSIRGSVA